MNTKNKIFQALAILCMTVLLWSCKNDDWHAVELDNTPVYELYALKDAETNPERAGKLRCVRHDDQIGGICLNQTISLR